MISSDELSAYIRNKQRTKITVIAVVVSVLLLAILINLSDLDKLIDSIININIAYVSISFLIFLLSIIVVSLRLLFVLRISSMRNIVPSLDISVIHTVLLCILPARLGDLCYPFILNKNLNVSISHSFVNLLVLRLYDFMISTLLLFISSVILSGNMEDKYFLQKMALILFIIITCILSATKYFSSINIRSTKYKNKSAGMKKIIDILCQLQEGFYILNIVDHLILFCMTFIKWILSIGVIYFIFRSLNMDIQAIETILVTIGMNLVVALPIQTIGGFGITEASMAFLLGLVGFETNEAVTYSLTTRIIWLSMPASLGVLWLLIRNTVLKNKSN